MKKSFTLFSALVFMGTVAMAMSAAQGLNSAPKNTPKARIATVCGLGHDKTSAHINLSKVLNYKFIALDQDYAVVGVIYSAYLQGPLKLHGEILYEDISWGGIDHAACIMAEGTL